MRPHCLRHCRAAAGVSVSLTATVEKGLDDHEVGDILRYGIRHPAVNSAVFQPTTHAGRMVEFDPLERLTNPDVIRALAAQVPGYGRRTSSRCPAASPLAAASPTS